MRMSGITIRRAMAYDLPRMYEIEKECFSVPWSSDGIAAAVVSDVVTTLCAELSGELAGYGMIAAVCDESELLNLAVTPGLRRRGAGKALLTALLSDAAGRGAAITYLEVRESNGAARALYEKFGFSAVGRRKNYYTSPTEDALIMAKKLEQSGDSNDNPRD